jgi:predicted membrane channel-forming protein YqfA (hemolysin III family)
MEICCYLTLCIAQRAKTLFGAVFVMFGTCVHLQLQCGVAFFPNTDFPNLFLGGILFE